MKPEKAERKEKVLVLGLITTNVEDEAKIKWGKNKGDKEIADERIHLSFFKTISLQLDYFVRMRINSVSSFLNYIEDDASYFSSLINSEIEETSISIRLDEIIPTYLAFCTKYGLKIRSIEEEQKVLKENGLKLKYFENSPTSVFVNIRWKTYSEKGKSKIFQEAKATWRLYHTWCFRSWKK